MKTTFLYAILFCLTIGIAQANRDSVGFFYKEDKVVVLINERTSYGRLHALLDHLNLGDRLNVLSNDETIKLSCTKSWEGVGCTFRFFPSENVTIENRSLIAEASLEALGLDNNGEFEISFASSMKDKLHIRITEDGKLIITGSKK
jgi:hypothetical protein